MAALNIRNVGEDLIKRLKADAALNGMTLRDYVLMQLDGAERIKSGRGSAKSVANPSNESQAVAGKPANPADHSSAEMPTAPISKISKTCKHGTAKGWNCWQCGGIANVE